MGDPFHVVCPDCRAVNRVLPEKISNTPKCGKCGHVIMAPKPVSLTGSNFDAVVGRSTLPVLVDFWAPWCAPCKAMAPAFEQAAEMLFPTVLLAKLDTQAEPAIGRRMRIQGVPTMALFQGGREKARVSGAMSANSLAAWARSNL